MLSDQSVHDPLTGVFNRRHCTTLMGQQEALLAKKSRDRTYTACVGLMLLDVDHFKKINDTYGHSAGDAVLVEIARRLQELVRQHDVVVRWGGEEFVLVLPGTSAEGMLVLAGRLLRTIADSPVMAEGQAIPVTVSVGCVAYPLFPNQAWQDTLKVADLAMYLAKQGGRNRALCVMGVNEGALVASLATDLAWRRGGRGRVGDDGARSRCDGGCGTSGSREKFRVRSDYVMPRTYGAGLPVHTERSA
ncbi:GGDEF domain-containing protein [Massilia sp. H-1]|nr:GGDEF domain-containing protein [Massilia sp. H-1]